MNKKCGIYVIVNSVNDKVYVGQSVNIQSRWYAHVDSSKHNRQDSYTLIHAAMRKYGIQNFHYEILEECKYEMLNEREVYWIKEKDSYNNGYNMTLGGEDSKGESNGRSILTLGEVEEIRLAYNSHIPFREVYKKYEDKISKRGLQKIWRNETWQHVMQEVYTDENRKWHSTYAKSHQQKGKGNNAQKACSEEEIKRMRELRSTGLSYEKIGKILNRSRTVVRKYCLFQESKSPNNGTAIKVKNIETGLCFESLTEAAKWSQSERHKISNSLKNGSGAGHVPSTNQLAHWIKL